MIPALINAHPTLYLTLCWLVLAAALAAGGAWLWSEVRVRPTLVRARQARRGRLAFLALLTLAVVLFRQPSVWRSDCHQIDATCVLVAAQMFQADPVPWRGVSIGIHGPLEAYTLIPWYWAGWPPVPATARAYALLCVLAVLLASGATLARLGGAGAAVPAGIAVGLWAAFAKEKDAYEWNSEHLPMALLAVAVWCYVRARGTTAPARAATAGWLLATGLLLGAVPYAKLQAVPLALVLTAAALLELARGATWAGRRLAGLLALVLGGLTLPLLFTSITLATGTWQEFIFTYFAFAQNYGSATGPVLPVVESLLGFDTPWLLLFAVLVGSSFVVLAGWRSRPRPAGYGYWLGGALFFLAVTLYAINAAHMGYHHYALLLVPPLALLLGLLTGPAWQTLVQGWRVTRRWPLYAALASLVLGVGGWVYVFQRGSLLQLSEPQHPLYGWSTLPPGLRRWLPIPRDTAIYSAPTRAFAQQLARLAQPHDRLAVWGWAPQYFLESGLPNATRSLCTVGEMAPGAWVRLPPAAQTFYRQRYLQDLQQHRPEWFIDAVSAAEFVFSDRATCGHETWPELRDYVAANYLQVGVLKVTENNGSRLFLRRDLQGTRGTPPPLH